MSECVCGEPLLTVENVSIAYKQGDFKDIGLKDWVTQHLTKNYHVTRFMAVKNASFTLSRGELLGIVGTNGAGKSTLLKAVAGIMEPKGGVIDRRGRVSALLELGSGFDGELTVKENAYLRGAMLGYTRKFMDDTYGEIIGFAELEEVQNRPFKQLSTGMQSRLAFSIASLVEPEILVLDEVLSVGDGAFQEKSAKKMQEIIHSGAATILVSHSLSQIRQLSTKVLWLNHGQQIALGDTAEVCDRYQAFLDGDEGALRENWQPFAPAEMSALIRLEEVWMRGADGAARTVFQSGESWELCLRCRAASGVGAWSAGFAIVADDGTILTGGSSGEEQALSAGGETLLCMCAASLPLTAGDYTLLCGVWEGRNFSLTECRKAGSFRVEASREQPGFVALPQNWHQEK